MVGGLLVGLLGSASAQDPSPARRLQIAEAEASVGAADSVAREIELLGKAKLSLRERHRMARKALALAKVAGIKAQPGAVLDVCRAVATAFPHTETAPKAYLLAAKTLRARLRDPQAAIETAQRVLAIPIRAGFVAQSAYRDARSAALEEIGACHLAQGEPLRALQDCLDGLKLDSLWAFKPSASLVQVCRALAETRLVSKAQVADAVAATPRSPVRRAGRVIAYQRSTADFLERLAQALARDGRNAASMVIRSLVDRLAHRPVRSSAPPVLWGPVERAIGRDIERERVEQIKQLSSWRARAGAGDAAAMLALGRALSEGVALLRDTKASDVWIQRAADAGLPKACLVRYHELTRVRGRRYDPAVEGALLTQAGGRGSLELWFHLRKAPNLNGLGVAELEGSLERTAAKGDVWAYLCLGKIALRTGRRKRARTLLLRAGQLGEASAALPLLLQIAKGQALPQERLVLSRCAKRVRVDSVPSLRTFAPDTLQRLRAQLASASRAHPLAQEELSRMLTAGLGGARDRPKAAKVYYASLLTRDLSVAQVEESLLLDPSTWSTLLAQAREGDPRAVHVQAACLEESWDTRINAVAIPLHREDARRRDVPPCTGTMPDWSGGLETEATLNRELAWARRHAAQGDRWATAYLGYLSQELLADHDAAQRWLSKAAGMGCAWAALKLSEHLDDKRLVWLRRAAELGDRSALTSLADEARRAEKPEEAKRWRLAAIKAGDPRTLRREVARLLQAKQPTQAAALLRRLSAQGDKKGYVALLLLLLEHPELREPTDP